MSLMKFWTNFCTLYNMRINSLIQIDQKSILDTTSYQEIKKAFSATNHEYLPVHNGSSEFIGALYRQDFVLVKEEFFDISEMLHHKVLYEHYHILETIREFMKVDKKELPTVDEDGFYIGICSLKDVQFHFHRTLGLIEGGSLVVIETEIQNYSLVDIARIVEGNQAKVMTQYVSSHPNTKKIEVTLILNISDISDVIATFERFDYKVLYTSVATDKDDFLKERYDSFMHFLDI